MRLVSLGFLLCALVFSIAGPAAADDPPPIIQTIIVSGDTDLFLSEAANAKATFKRLGIDARRRYLQASLAGDSAGTVALVIEYPNLQALAAAQAKLQNDSAWQAYIQKIDGKTTIESNSVWSVQAE